MNASQEIGQIGQQRAAVYAWFSGLFASELDKNALDNLQSEPVEQWLNALSDEPLMQNSVSQFQQIIQAVTIRPDAILELSADFASLFLMATPVETQPYASMHINKDNPRYYGQSSADMQNLLTKLGLQTHEAFHEPEDHLAIILELLSHLAYATSEQMDNQYELLMLQQQQISQLLVWLPAFSTACQQHDKFGFYAALADLTLNFIQSDRLWLAEIVPSPHLPQ
ncbi:Chaperone protein TorD [Pragia fontium]|uniref:molecular chaperone TorD n=1 Tax=Pragia fontium TaxID=82985 RepID=UPI000E01DEC3|nr:molecular chaperone TorD [Pragia fontium]SUB83588.1 Chaperone protein TorD [Pragia fontium]